MSRKRRENLPLTRVSLAARRAAGLRATFGEPPKIRDGPVGAGPAGGSSDR